MLDPKGNEGKLENTIYKLGLVLSSLSPYHLSANPKDLHSFIRHQIKEGEVRARYLTHFRDLPLPVSLTLTISATFREDP